VEHGKPADYSALSQEQLTVLRSTLRGLKLLIIDEVSMVSSLTLLFIHLRLTEVMNSKDLFGGISVVFFADLLQLPPVKGNQPFLQVTFLEAKQRLGAIGSIDLWKTFTYNELTINMRQSGDKQYADLLSTVRVGTITDQQYALLAQRQIVPGQRATVSEISQLFQTLSDGGESPLILMPTSALCQQVNKAMMQQIGNQVYNLKADDCLDTIVDKLMLAKTDKAYQKISEDSTRTAGLEKHLELCVGARVMLKRNRDIEIGLVNGSVGTVVGFNSSSPVSLVKVKFDRIECPIDIERLTHSFEVLKKNLLHQKAVPADACLRHNHSQVAGT
jgi:ATP-dependent exoDNAse (exonuclease V) alpha subunit